MILTTRHHIVKLFVSRGPPEANAHHLFANQHHFLRRGTAPVALGVHHFCLPFQQVSHLALQRGECRLKMCHSLKGRSQRIDFRTRVT